MKEAMWVKTVKSDEVDRIVARIDETRSSEHFRIPDRSNAHFVKPRRRQDPAIRRAKTRLRTAAYRNRLDQRCAPSTHEIAMALVVALVTTPSSSSMSRSDWTLVGRALADLQRRGFDLAEVRSTLRKLRDRIDPADSEDNQSTDPVNLNPWL
jgi:hypothetical protein